MLLFDRLAEQRIAEAIKDGAFDNLPGQGKPLALDDDRLIPEDVRVAYRLLRNAGFVPAEVEARREIADLRRLVASVGDNAAQRRAVARLAVLEEALAAQGRGGALRREGAYRARLLARWGG